LPPALHTQSVAIPDNLEIAFSHDLGHKATAEEVLSGVRNNSPAAIWQQTAE
jgi:hypothetical protein